MGMIGDIAHLFMDPFVNAKNFQQQENNLNWQKLSQNTQWEREDTAYQRTVDDMSAAGLNPIASMKTVNQAGEVVPTTASQLQLAPSRAGGIMELVNGISNLNTQGLQRDALRAENNYQQLLNQEKQIENTILANKNGISFDENGNPILSKDFVKEQDIGSMDYRNSRATTERNERENEFQGKYGGHDLQSTINAIATDTTMQADRALNGLNDFAGNIADNAADSAIGILFDNMVDKVKKSGEDFSKNIAQAWENDKNRIKKAGNAIKKGASKIGSGIKNVGKKAFNSINSSYQNSTYKKNKGR